MTYNEHIYTESTDSDLIYFTPLKVLMCDCATNAFYATIILANGDSLDIKDITCAIIQNYISYFDWF